MTVFRIPKEHFFPHAALAEPNGLLGVGGDLHPNRLMLAYRSRSFLGIVKDSLFYGFLPNPRFVLDPKELYVPRSLKQSIRKKKFRSQWTQPLKK